MAHLLVTGGAGFIGSNLVDALLAEGDRVTVLDDLSTGKRRNLAHLEGKPRFHFVEGSILDAPLVERLVTEVDGVYHLAAVVGVKYVLADPLRGMQVNLRGTEHILEAASRHGGKVLIASSSEVFGKSVAVPFDEEDDTVLGPTRVPRWSYALTKLLDEHLALAYHRQRGLPTVVVRYFNAYGPRIDPRGYGSVVAHFLGQALSGCPLTVYGDGQQTRAFTFVGDTVRGTMAAMETEAAVGEVFNIGNGQEWTVEALAELVRELIPQAGPIRHIPFEEVYGPDFEETRRRAPATGRAERVLGFRAQVPLEEGLRRTIPWFKEHLDELI